MLDFDWRYPPVRVDWAKHDQVCAYYVEGWQYDRDPGPEAAPDLYRHGRLNDSDSILAWLHQKDHFNPPRPQTEGEWGHCTGGFRLLIFDKTRFFPLTTTIDQTAANALIEAFHLLPETIPIITLAEGGFRHRFERHDDQRVRSLELVMQSNQVLKVANFMISLHFDFETKWTTAIACVDHEDPDDSFDQRLPHVLATSMNRGLWAHPTFLPMAFATHYGEEMRESRSLVRGDLTNVNRRLGISTARSFRSDTLPDDWPMTLDTRWLVVNTHSRRMECIQVAEGCRWSCRSFKFLAEVEEQILKQDMLNWNVSHNMLKLIEYQSSVVEGTDGKYRSLMEEAEANSALAYNTTSQKDSKIAQRHNEVQKKIAISTKEDSISMATFTFITALFLPGTFVATFLSLTMIDWQPQPSVDAHNSSATTTTPSSSTPLQGHQAQVSQYYWVFWAIDIPLTVLVMLGWYIWYRRTKNRWIKENGIMPRSRERSSGVDVEKGSVDTASSRSNKVGNTSIQQQAASQLGPLPSGWEMRLSNTARGYFVNHNSKTTSWDDPRLPSSLDQGVPSTREISEGSSTSAGNEPSTG